mmetsp:Transcript_5305/g.9075  ORF Transcript_5305/g.9075 Transcript_5305/m.9075 type:complete len:559 (-) Transcript_5305:7-1683(-)
MNNNNTPKCTLYLAPSTIPNAGLGIFTSIALPSGTPLPGGFDAAIPISDMDFHNDGSHDAEDYHWMFSEYLWSSASIGKVMEYEAEKTSGFSWGHGALPNCHFWMINVMESSCDFDTVGLTPENSPGAGAFTGHYNRLAHAYEDVKAGGELFVSYGTNWFTTRESYMGLVPGEDDFEAGEEFIETVSELFESLVDSTTVKDDVHYMGQVRVDIWNMIVNSPYKSRPLAALPKAYKTAVRAMDVGIMQTEEELATHSVEYLEEHGKCLDHIHPQNTTIPHAGRGAFATRYLPKGTVVSSAPLIHIPDRDILTMYDDSEDGESRDLSKPIGQQLLLNYCWGHPKSSMLLCPYSHGTPFINHDRQDPNVKIQWMKNDDRYHNSSWLDEPVSFFDSEWTTKLMFEYVALRDIQEGEEVLVDYGKEWEEAWNEHVKAWNPDENYVSPHELNKDYDLPLKTHEEDASVYTDIFGYHTGTDKKSGEREIHRIRARRPDPNNKNDGFVYDLEVIGNGNYVKRVKDVSRSQMHFYHKPYKADIFREGSFRHEMMIPDEMFPNAWRNL